MEGDDKRDNGTKVRCTVEVTRPDGTTVRKVVESSFDDIPTTDDFDLCTLEGFRRDFDHLERAVLSTGRKAQQGILEEFLDDSSKKKPKQGRKDGKRP